MAPLRWIVLTAWTASICATVQGQSGVPFPTPPPAGVTAPKLAPLGSDESQAALATPRHCELRVGSEPRLIANEEERQAVVKVGETLTAIKYQGENPVRNGGRFVPTPATFDLWVAVNPSEDRSLAKGMPRHVTVLVNGANGGSEAFAAAYICNY